MQREEIFKICKHEALDQAAELYNTQRNNLKVFADYEGAANLVYEFKIDERAFILRLSFRPDRSIDQIRAELDFVEYLAGKGIQVSEPVPSRNGKLVEVIRAKGVDFRIAAFIKGEGIRVPDNGYQYRTDAPIEEYFQNWGQILAQMHQATKRYEPPDHQIRRPGWFELHQNRLALTSELPDHLHLVRTRIQSTLDAIQSLPKEPDAYGLIHGDFNDGNFTVDYSNGKITVFDFDDCCYFWFMYELASAWEGGIGRTMFSNRDDRKSFMEHYMDQVLQGYWRANWISTEWLARLPLFIRLIQMEEFLHYFKYIDNKDERMQLKIAYKIKCIEDEIPYMGFFDDIYSPKRPFSM
jgi:Ser/Thr protein kinase RdoA (MazF antagonist)